jgi:hypothetical protein
LVAWQPVLWAPLTVVTHNNWLQPAPCATCQPQPVFESKHPAIFAHRGGDHLIWHARWQALGHCLRPHNSPGYICGYHSVVNRSCDTLDDGGRQGSALFAPPKSLATILLSALCKCWLIGRLAVPAFQPRLACPCLRHGVCPCLVVMGSWFSCAVRPLPRLLSTKKCAAAEV